MTKNTHAYAFYVWVFWNFVLESVTVVTDREEGKQPGLKYVHVLHRKYSIVDTYYFY